MLDKLDARVLLLPQLQMTIDGRRDDKVRAAFLLSKKVGGMSPVFRIARKFG